MTELPYSRFLVFWNHRFSSNICTHVLQEMWNSILSSLSLAATCRICILHCFHFTMISIFACFMYPYCASIPIYLFSKTFSQGMNGDTAKRVNILTHNALLIEWSLPVLTFFCVDSLNIDPALSKAVYNTVIFSSFAHIFHLHILLG